MCHKQWPCDCTVLRQYHDGACMHFPLAGMALLALRRKTSVVPGAALREWAFESHWRVVPGLHWSSAQHQTITASSLACIRPCLINTKLAHKYNPSKVRLTSPTVFWLFTSCSQSHACTHDAPCLHARRCSACQEAREIDIREGVGQSIPVRTQT